MANSVRRVIGLATIGLVAAATTALGAGVASAQETPPPVAMISNLTGKSTSVALDKGFTDALSSLDVTPGPFGSASISDGSASFPITGGNVTVYKPNEVLPYVQGRIEHMGSGLTLTKGDTEVTLDNFVIDPGDPAVLTGRVRAGGQTVAESVREWATAWKDLRRGTPLADYGEIDNLLECVSSYTHEVASLNAANVWSMRTAAWLRARTVSPASTTSTPVCMVSITVSLRRARSSNSLPTRSARASLARARRATALATPAVMKKMIPSTPALVKLEVA